MAIIRPLLCVSHTVRGTATIAVEQSAGIDTIVVPEGMYWTDPKGLNSAKDLLKVFADLFFDTFGAPNGLASSYSPTSITTNGLGYWAYYEPVGAFTDHKTYFGNALTTTEGRRLARRLGLPVLNDSTVLNGDFGVIEGVWSPSLAEFGSMQRPHYDGVGGLNPSWDGHVFPYSVGETLRRYKLRFDGLVEAEVWSKGLVQAGTNATNHLALETVLFKHLRRGELLRLYENRDATSTYTTVAMTALSITCTVAASGYVTGDIIWVDGECMRVTGTSGGGVVLAVERDDPVAHPAYAPVSEAFVGTFALDESGGEVNIAGFDPKRREHYDSRQDVDITLVQTVWEG